MSDKRNRDIGRKRVYQKHHNQCGCWHCEEAATKLRILKERAATKYKNKDMEG